MSHRRAFTGIDILATGAASLVALALAQPLLEQNQSTNLGLSNLAQHQRLAARQGMFMLASNGQFTGANVTGWIDVPGANQSDAHYVGNTSPSTPTQTTDWITPLIGDELDLSRNRALRTQQLFEQVRDPRNTRLNDALFGSAPDANDFNTAAQIGGYYTTSYLAPATFHYWGTPNPGGFIPGKGTIPGDTDAWLEMYGGIPYNWGLFHNYNIKTPRDYRPTINAVGPSPSQKVMFADGTRYVDSQGVIDIELDSSPGLFGNFITSFFAWDGEAAHGRNRPGINYSARRPGLRPGTDNRVMYITFSDGSTRTSTVARAKARPDWWAPSGSEWVSFDGIAPEASAQYQIGDTLP